MLVTGLVVASLSCAHPRNPDGAPASTPPAPVHVRVTNRYRLDVVIFASASGHTHRLGVVAPGLDRTFVLPQGMVGSGSVEFSAQPTAYGPIVRSGELSLAPGDVVYFEITTNWNDSRATVRP